MRPEWISTRISQIHSLAEEAVTVFVEEVTCPYVSALLVVSSQIDETELLVAKVHNEVSEPSDFADLALNHTPSAHPMRVLASRYRLLRAKGRAPDHTAIRAAYEIFPADFQLTRYHYDEEEDGTSARQN